MSNVKGFFFSVFVSEIFDLLQLFVSIHGLTVSNSELAQSHLSFCIVCCMMPSRQSWCTGLFQSRYFSLNFWIIHSISFSSLLRSLCLAGQPSGLSQDIDQKNKCRFFQNELTVGKLSDKRGYGCSTSVVLML